MTHVRESTPLAEIRRVMLVRHGRSAHEHDGSWIDAASARRFEKRYDAAPIRTDATPPEALAALARMADLILASDLPRAVTSARTIAPDRDPIVSPLLRELSFDLPAWGPRLPLSIWDGLHYLTWSARLMLGIESAEIRRARRAVEWLDSVTANAALSIAITHGGFRRLLAAQLLKRGWRHAPGWRRYHNWSVWTLWRDQPVDRHAKFAERGNRKRDRI